MYLLNYSASKERAEYVAGFMKHVDKSVEKK